MMKPKILIPILAVAALALAIFLVVSRRTVADQVQQISTLSNEWQKASIRVSDLTQVNSTLEKDLTKRNTEFLSLTNAYAQALTTLSKTETELKQTEDSLKMTKEQLEARDAKIAQLEQQNQELDTKSAELSTAITNLTSQIEATQKKLSAAEGDKAFLQSELNKLMAQKAELERQLNDLQFLKAQVAHLKAELSIARRLEWIRKGLFSPGDQKGAQQLLQSGPGARPSAPKTNNYDLNVEIKSDGSVKVIAPLTNAPAH
jgi:chromosome segregation ATPase